MTFEQGLLLFAQVMAVLAAIGLVLMVAELAYDRRHPKEEEVVTVDRLAVYRDAYYVLRRELGREPTTEEIWQEIGL